MSGFIFSRQTLRHQTTAAASFLYLSLPAWNNLVPSASSQIHVIQPPNHFSALLPFSLHFARISLTWKTSLKMCTRSGLFSRRKIIFHNNIRNILSSCWGQRPEMLSILWRTIADDEAEKTKHHLSQMPFFPSPLKTKKWSLCGKLLLKAFCFNSLFYLPLRKKH